MEKKHSIFKVIETFTTLSGNYARCEDIPKQDSTTLITNRNYKSGDMVEVWERLHPFDWVPDRIEVNGIVTWEGKDRDEYLRTRVEKEEQQLIARIKEKGRYHKKYNPNPELLK